VRALAQTPLTTSVGRSLLAGSASKLYWGVEQCAAPLSVRLCMHAVKLGYLPMLIMLRARGCPWTPAPDVIGGEAASFDDDDDDEHPRRWDWAEDVCARAALYGHAPVLQFYGHAPVLQWLHLNGRPWDEYTCASAAHCGHLAVLQWARANGCPWDAETCSAAADGGHLSVMRWARANGCPWDATTCSEAARSGHLAVLQWARAN
jgi:hypothetical protein